MPLFNCSPELPDGFKYYPSCISEHKANKLYQHLVDSLDWQQPSLNMYGKQVLIPRKQVYMADKQADYSYSGSQLLIAEWDPIIENLMDKIAQQFSIPLNAVLINWYRDGQDSVGWHADDEAELGRYPSIVSISLGETRLFKLRENRTQQVINLYLENGSCLFMNQLSQQNYQHCVPKQNKVSLGRINLTFRYIQANN